MRNGRMLPKALLYLALGLSLLVPPLAEGASGAGPLPVDRPSGYSTADSPDDVSAMTTNAFEPKVLPMVAEGAYHTVGLQSDGTAVVVGSEVELAK